MQIYDVKFQEN